MNAATPTIELPAGGRLLTPREIAKRMGVSVETATKLLSEGQLIAYTTAGTSAQVHIAHAAKYAVAQ